MRPVILMNSKKIDLKGHALADHALQAGEADAELVLQQLADGTDTTVAELVDIVRKACLLYTSRCV